MYLSICFFCLYLLNYVSIVFCIQLFICNFCINKCVYANNCLPMPYFCIYLTLVLFTCLLLACLCIFNSFNNFNCGRSAVTTRLVPVHWSEGRWLGFFFSTTKMASRVSHVQPIDQSAISLALLLPANQSFLGSSWKHVAQEAVCSR